MYIHTHTHTHSNTYPSLLCSDPSHPHPIFVLNSLLSLLHPPLLLLL